METSKLRDSYGYRILKFSVLLLMFAVITAINIIAPSTSIHKHTHTPCIFPYQMR